MEETLIANRLLYDPKLIKRVLKAFQEPNTFEKQQNLLQSIQMLEHHIHLQEISIRMNKLEYENLQVEALQKRDDVERHQGKIAKLEAELETAKLKRKEREQYDLIAKQINKVNSRRKSNQQISERTEEINLKKNMIQRMEGQYEKKRRLLCDLIKNIETVREEIKM